MTIVSSSAPQAGPLTEPQAPRQDGADVASFLALLDIGHAREQETAPAPDPLPRMTAREDTPQTAARMGNISAPPRMREAPSAFREQRPDFERDTPSGRPAAEISVPSATADADPDSASPADDAKMEQAVPADGQDAPRIITQQKKSRPALDDPLDIIARILQTLIEPLSALPGTADTVATETASTAAAAQIPAVADAYGVATQPQTPQDNPVIMRVPESGAMTTLTQAPVLPAGIQGPADALPGSIAAQEQPAAGKIAIPAARHISTDARDHTALLSDIRSLLKQVRDRLKAVDGDTPRSAAPSAALAGNAPVAGAAPPPVTPLTDLQSLVTRIQQDMDVLEQRLITAAPLPETVPQTAGTPIAAPALPAELPSPPDVLFPFLKNGILQIRRQLQEWQHGNETVHTQPETPLQQQFEAAQSRYRDTPVSVSLPDAAVTAEALLSTATATAATATATATVTASTATAPAATDAAHSPMMPDTPAPATGIAPLSPADGSGSQSGQQGQNPHPQSGSAPLQSTTHGSAAQAANPEPGRGQAPSFARSLSQSQPAPLHEQVAVQIRAASTDGSSRIRIQLDPADLGRIDIKLTVDSSGKTGVSILVEQKATLDLLLRDAASLTRSLNEAGLSTDSGSLSFNLRSGQQEEQGNPRATHTYRKTQPESDEEPLLNIISRNYVVNLAEGLDISI